VTQHSSSGVVEVLLQEKRAAEIEFGRQRAQFMQLFRQKEGN